MRALRIALLISAFGAASAQAGMFDDEEARRQIKDLSIKNEARFDQQGKTQLDLANQLSRQSEEIARLRGQVETLTYELETAKKRQQDFYLDLDTRLRKLEPQGGSSAAAVDPASGANSGGGGGGDPAKESRDYEAALNNFKAAKYKEASWGFSAFVQKYPDSSLAPNAQFWLGNAFIAQRNSAKAPDSWLAMATCQQELGNAAAAKRSLETLVAKYPNAPAADTARDRLKKK